MFYPQNLHTHGVLCDGKNEYEDTVQKAIELGLTSLGFSGHSYTEYSNGLYCMTEENTPRYKKEIARLKEKYKDKLEIFCGLEFDMYSTDDMKDYDYIIGTMHYFKFGNNYVTFDRNPTAVQDVIDNYFDGDGMKYAKEYYRQFAELPNYGKFDLVGHFDIITKHSKTHTFFDETSPEYRKYALDCLHALAEKIDVFEVNTGAVARGYRDTPYPREFLLKEIQKLGCGVTLGSDCHDNRFLNHHFHEAAEFCKACGFKELQILTKEGFKGIPLE
jgi:histidinol-phosphatase (PHP family)